MTERPVIAVCVPNRGLAASFAALGAVLAEPLPTPTPDDIKQHFAHLVNLPDPSQRPTALTYLHGGRKIRGSFAGAVIHGGSPLIKVCVQARAAYKSGGLTYFVQEGDAINLQVEPDVQPTLGRHPAGTALVPHGDFVRHFYDQDEQHVLHLAARCQVVIVGRINALREETTQMECAVPAKGDRVSEGALNDILRIRKFISQANHARTAVYATQRETAPSPEDQAATQFVIFDGADAYTKWGSYFPHSNVLVILDRTEPTFQDGLSQINTRYYVRSADYQWHTSAQVPASLDAIGFVEVRR